MSNAILVFHGYALYEAGRIYKSLIDDQWLRFDTVGQWYEYIKTFKR